jgi:hypothetical protein
MSGFKVKDENVTVEYFGVSNTLKLTIRSADQDEYGNTYHTDSHIYIEPHSNEIETVIKCLQKTLENL